MDANTGARPLTTMERLAEILAEFQGVELHIATQVGYKELAEYILAKLLELGFVRLEDVEIDKEKLLDLFHATDNDGNMLIDELDEGELAHAIAEAKGILRVKK